MVNPWEKIFENDFTSANTIADNNYLSNPNDFDLRARGISSLLLKKYDKAVSDFVLLRESELKNNRISDGTYLYIGLCYYAMHETENAVQNFLFPISNSKSIKYTNDIGRPGCVLYFLANKLNDANLQRIANKELKKRKTKISFFLLGETDSEDIERIYIEETNETLQNRYQCKVEFYKAVKELAAQNFDHFYQHLENSVSLKGKYLEFEYFMAKVELDEFNSR